MQQLPSPSYYYNTSYVYTLTPQIIAGAYILYYITSHTFAFVYYYIERSIKLMVHRENVNFKDDKTAKSWNSVKYRRVQNVHFEGIKHLSREQTPPCSADDLLRSRRECRGRGKRIAAARCHNIYNVLCSIEYFSKISFSVQIKLLVSRRVDVWLSLGSQREKCRRFACCSAAVADQSEIINYALRNRRNWKYLCLRIVCRFPLQKKYTSLFIYFS